MCKVSFADNSETVGHTGIARLCCSQRTARTRIDCLLLARGSPRLFRRGRMSQNHPMQTEKGTNLLDPGEICLFLSVNQQSLSITIEEACRRNESNLILEDLLQKIHALFSPYHLFQFQA